MDLNINRYTYSDLKVGQMGGYSVRVTKEMLEKFCELTGDINPLHTNEEFAIKHGFDSCVCYGMLTASFLSTLAGVYLPGENCLIQQVDIKFTKPVYIGETLEINGTIIELYDSVQQVVIKVEIRNQKDEKVLRGKMKVGMLHG